MKQIKGIWFPDDDTHFEKVIDDEGNYQQDTFDYAMFYVKEPKIFYDIGAHVGLWSLMAIKAGFKWIDAYEPNPINAECLIKNIENTYHPRFVKALINQKGIGKESYTAHINYNKEGNSGAISYSPDKKGNIKIEPFYYEKKDWDKFRETCLLGTHDSLIKIDTEGTEGECVQSMAELICDIKPVICVEQKSNKDALEILQKMGMEIVKQVRKDYILTWKNQ